MNRRTFVKRSVAATAVGLTAVGLAAGGGYARFVERHAVEVVPVELELGLREPLTATVLSDIHFDPLYEVDYLEEVVARVNGLSADLILYTGDFLSLSAERLTDLLAVLHRARAPLGSFAILGNHDHWIGANYISAAFAATGIPILRNRSVMIPGRKDWYLTGLESFWVGKPNVAPILSTPPQARHILLVHEPDPFDLLTDPRIALQLSGHTHGGQIRVPLVGAICLPSLGKKYQAGLYAQGDRRLYVNRGIGTVNRHVRFNCRPEITLLKLT
jgi:predicted MPP superfamily phosphohydrolase